MNFEVVFSKVKPGTTVCNSDDSVKGNNLKWDHKHTLTKTIHDVAFEQHNTSHKKYKNKISMYYTAL